MISRVLFLVIGLVAVGAGGFLGWINRSLAGALFPPDTAHAPWPLVGAVALIAIGLVSLGAGVAPRKTSRRAAEAKTAEQAAALQVADTYYATRTSPVADHPADRDWRSADLPAAAPVAPPPAETAAKAPPAPLFVEPPAAPPPLPLAQPPAAPTLPVSPPPPPPPPLPPPPPPELPRTVSPPAAPPPVDFPATATLAPIPHAVDPPAPPPAAAPAAPAPSAAPAHDDTPTGRIRAALAAHRLEEADKLLADERDRLSRAGDGDPTALAVLTGLAGDHAAADGRVGGAKWLWRLALQRFAKADAMSSVEARAVAERLRLADQ